MLSSFIYVFGAFAPSIVSAVAKGGASDHDFVPNDTIVRDVLIIGGGSAGTYSAIRLGQLGKTVVVIEKEAQLGGHTNTYIDPVTGAPVDYGVAVWEDLPVVHDYFSYLEVPLTTVNFSGPSPFTNLFADFAAGVIIPGDQIPQTDPTNAFIAYLNEQAKYPYINNGFDLPTPVPSDLLINFGDFITKYNLDPISQAAFEFGQGLGNILAQPTLYMLKLFNTDVVGGILNGFLTTADHHNHELYDAALAKLGSNALLNTTVKKIERTGDGIKAIVSTPSGQTVIKSKKLLIAIPPKLDNLSFLDLEDDARALFSQFNNSCYYNSVIRNSGVPDDTSLTNLALTSPEGIPALPGMYTVQATGVPGLHTAYYGSPFPIPLDQVKASMLSDIAKVVKAAGFPPANGTAEFAAFGDHSPFQITVSVDAINAGFYDKMNALQGKQQTWWTGAAWQTQDSSEIWKYSEQIVLPQLVK
jgi:hypothetical protein